MDLDGPAVSGNAPNHGAREIAAPTHLLGFEGVATSTRTPMWAAAVVGDNHGRLMVANGSSFEMVSDLPWVCPVTASSLLTPLPIELVHGFGCLVLDRRDTQHLDGGPMSGRSGQFAGFAARGPGPANDELGAAWMVDEFVLWYCSPEEAFEVRERLRRGWWRAICSVVAQRGETDTSASDELRELAFRVQRSASKRVDWAYAIAAFERASETGIARRVHEMVLREVDPTVLDAAIEIARNDLSRSTPRTLGAYLARARHGQTLPKDRKAA